MAAAFFSSSRCCFFSFSSSSTLSKNATATDFLNLTVLYYDGAHAGEATACPGQHTRRRAQRARSSRGSAYVGKVLARLHEAARDHDRLGDGGAILQREEGVVVAHLQAAAGRARAVRFPFSKATGMVSKRRPASTNAHSDDRAAYARNSSKVIEPFLFTSTAFQQLIIWPSFSLCDGSALSSQRN